MNKTLRALALLSINSALFAEETAVPELPTIVVTGDLWESELQNTTSSVTVIDEAALEVNGVQHFENVINAIPNLTWTGGTSRPRYIQIRGIGENSQFEGETPDSSVRFLIDDFDLTGLGSVGNLFDVQQVEVLRGPQAGAFGANAAGGVIRIVSNDPTPYWTGQAEATVGSDSLFSEGIAVGGPILKNDPEQLTFRIAVHQLNQDGFRENKFTNDDDTNQRDELTTRLKLRWIANEDWQFDASLFYADFDNGFDEFTLSNSRTRTYSDQPGEDKQTTFGSSLRSTWTGLDTVEVVSVSSFVTSDSTYGYDGDWTNPTRPLYTYTSYLDVKRARDVFNQEIRFNSVETEDALGWIDRWTTGIYYQHFDEDTKTVGTGDFPDRFKTSYTTDTFTLYGQVTHNFSEATRLTLGLRAEYFDLSTGEDAPDGADFDDWLYGGKLTLEHDLSETQTAFASVTQGYKAGGANIYPYLDPQISNTYDSETLWNYEIGLRSEWFDGAVLSQITLFYLDRDDAQLRGSDGDTISFSYFTINGNEADHYGVEAETTWFINKNLTFNASLGLLQTNRDSFTAKGNSGLNYPSGDISNSPSYTYSASLNYVADNGLFANISTSGSDEYYESESPKNRNEQTRHSFTVVDASVGYRYQNWTFTVWAKNLFGEEYEERVYYFDNGNGEQRYESPADPRNFGVTANYRW